MPRGVSVTTPHERSIAKIVSGIAPSLELFLALRSKPLPLKDIRAGMTERYKDPVFLDRLKKMFDKCKGLPLQDAVSRCTSAWLCWSNVRHWICENGSTCCDVTAFANDGKTTMMFPHLQPNRVLVVEQTDLANSEEVSEIFAYW